MNRVKNTPFPEAFIERLYELLPRETADTVLEACSHPRPTTLRLNPLRASRAQLLDVFTRHGIAVQPVAWWDMAFVVTEAPLRQLTDLDEYKRGWFYVQSLSSMIPPLVLEPHPGEKILDITAAPGSKTTQIAAMMENSGQIVANDNSHIRIYKLKANLETQGVTNTVVTNRPGQIFWQDYPEYFDRTLVDVPCSMEGRFISTDPKSYTHWSTKKIKELAERQRFLLRAAISATKPGGVIVYSTCTLAPEENEAILDWIIRKEADAISVERVALSGIEGYPPVESWHGKTYHPDVRHALRLLPDPTREGFFVARLRKNRSTVPKAITMP